MNRILPADELLAVKFAPPKVPHDMVEVASCAALDSARDFSFVAVVAPAGYGKSTILARHHERLVSRGCKVAWLHLDAYDDGFGFWHYVCEALRRIDPRQDFSWVRDVEESPSLATPLWTNRLINQIESIDSDFTLIIDDYHLITHENIHAETEHIVSYMPANMHLVIASREAMPFPLVRLSTQHQVLMLGAGDLSFTYAEVHEYLANALGDDLTPGQADEIVNCTQGWITGIKLLVMSQRTRMQGAMPADKTVPNGPAGADMSQVYSYLSEEVLHALSPAEQEFLMQTAFLDTLTVPLCNYILGTQDAADLLSGFESAGLFTSSIHQVQGSWRLHPLFREFLDEQAKLEWSEGRRRAALRAARWLEDQGLDDRAVGYYIEGGDFESALAGVERAYWSKGARRAYAEPVIKQLSRIPIELLVEHPRCMSLYAVLLFGTGAGSELARCITLVRSRGFSERPDEPRDARDWDMVRALATYTDGRYRTALKQFTAVLAQRTYDSFRTDGLLWIFVARCHYAFCEEEQVYAALEKSIDNARTHRMTEEYLMACCELARVKCEFGSYDESDRILRDAVAHAKLHAYRGIANEIMEFALASSEAERGHMRRLERFMQAQEGFIAAQKQDFGGWICAPDFFVALAHAYFMLGRYDQAETMIACAKDHIKRDVSVAFLPQRIAFLRLRVWSMSGQRDKVEGWVHARRGRRVHGEGPSEACEVLVDALAALLVGDNRRALTLLASDLPSDTGLPLAALKIDYHLIKAVASAAVRDHEQACNQMAVALRLGSLGNRIQQFVDWGPWVAELAQSALVSMSSDDGVTEAFAAYAARVGRACSQRWEQKQQPYWLEGRQLDAAGIQLTAREREVLEGLVARKTADEIARECFISHSTAQVHIHNVYRKLGVHDRMAAIEKGRIVLGESQPARQVARHSARDESPGHELPALGSLSAREAEVLKHMVDGKDNRQIASTLVMSEQTVRTHVKNIYRKLGVHSRAQAIQAALASDDPRLAR